MPLRRVWFYIVIYFLGGGVLGGLEFKLGKSDEEELAVKRPVRFTCDKNCQFAFENNI